MRKNGPTRRVFGMFWGFGKKYFIAFALKQLFGTVTPYFNLWMSAEIVTALYEGREAPAVWNLVTITLIGNLLIRIFSAIFSHFVGIEEKRMYMREKSAFNSKVLSLDYDKLENPDIRALRRKIVTNAWINEYGPKNMINTIGRLYCVLLDLTFSLVLFAEMTVSMASAGFSILGLLLFVLFVTVTVSNILWARYSKKEQAKYWEKIGDKLLEENRLAEALPTNEKDIRIYNMSSYIKSYWKNSNASHRTVFMETWRIQNRFGIPSLILDRLMEALSYLLVSLYCLMGIFPIGSIIKYVGYLGKMTRSVNILFSIEGDSKANIPFLETYLEFFDIKNDMYQGSLNVEKRSDKKYDVEFKNVSFKYPESNDYALKNINFKFTVGERLAVVGMNGSGKTTLIKLLCRLYDPTEGEIIMNDFNIRKYDYRQYLDVFSVVFQDYNLLSFSLGQNVSAGNGYDAALAEKYLREVGFGERLDEMERGLETPLYKNFDSAGVEISGGEAQKIALARALYKNAPFIILDEPTAALDPIAEAEIYSKFNDIVGDKTAIYISHRLSSCRFCDKILVLDHGEIVQFGTHDELLSEEKGKYYELWHAQSKYYTE